MIIPVVAACVVKKDPFRVLLHRKDEAADEKGIPRNPELVGRWEFPGGMMEYAETPEMTLLREIFEETGLVVNINRLVYAQTNIYQDKVHYLILFYECETSQVSAPNGCRYFEPAEVSQIDCLPGTSAVIRKLAQQN